MSAHRPRRQRAAVAALAAAALAAAASSCRPDADVASGGRAPRGPQARRGLAAAAAGCYALRVGPGTPAPGAPPTFPGRVRLDSAPLAEADARLRRLALLDSAAAAGRPEPPGHWTADSLSDTVRLWIGDTYAGTAVALAPVAAGSWDSLAGGAAALGDAGAHVAPVGAATAVRLPCGAGRRAPAT